MRPGGADARRSVSGPGAGPPRIRYYLAQSLDGYLAAPDGGVAWLDPFNTVDYGYEAFMAGIATVVLGRRTFDQALTFGAWPYPGKRAIVLTRRPVADPPPGVEFHEGPVGPLAARLRRESAGDVWIVGGAEAGRQFLDAGAVDELEIYVIPVLLGDGVATFPASDASAALELRESRAFPNGVVMLRYGVRAAR